MMFSSEKKPSLPKLIQTRKPLHHEAVPFVLLWAQKSGCTALVRWFFFHADELVNAEHYKSDDHGLDIHDYERNVFKQGAQYDSELIKKITDGTPCIQFLRCPYARAFSSYLHIHSRFFIRFTKEGKTTPGMNMRNSILRSLYGSEECIEYTFSFLEYLLWLRGQNINEIEIHHRPQVTAINTVAKPKYYRLEDFDTVSALLEREFDLKNSAERKSSFTAGHHVAKKSVADSSILELLNRGIPLSRSPAFAIPKISAEVLANTVFEKLIKEIFAEDVAAYNRIPTLRQ